MHLMLCSSVAQPSKTEVIAGEIETTTATSRYAKHAPKPDKAFWCKAESSLCSQYPAGREDSTHFPTLTSDVHVHACANRRVRDYVGTYV